MAKKEAKKNEGKATSKTISISAKSLIEKCKIATEKWAIANLFLPSEDEKTKLSKRAQEMKDLLDKETFGGHEEKVRIFAEIVLEEKIPAKQKPRYSVTSSDKKNGAYFDPFVVAVGIRPDVAHGFPANNQVLIVASTPSGSSFFGKTNNGTPLISNGFYQHREYWRPATVEEIENIVNDYLSYLSEILA
jgi:hypothetical protein